MTFDIGPRKVELEGEAYFEVCKTGQPFIVCTQGMQVEVLGTTFNISAYPQEEYQTTLVNGSVKVNTETGESCIFCLPCDRIIRYNEAGCDVTPCLFVSMDRLCIYDIGMGRQQSEFCQQIR